MRANKISLVNAKQNKLFYFVANAVIYRIEDQRCLILKRSDTEKVHPGLFGVVGGKLDWQDLDIAHPGRLNGNAVDFPGALENLLIRETREEAGIEIGTELHYINSVAFVRPDETPVMMVKVAALYKSGEVITEPGAFSDFAWVTAEEVKNYPCIGGIAEEVAQTIEHFKLHPHE